ncbi:hypothetical protein KM043_015630 [Ampulex compressa]|nr:hypothetical protein KM043_015630 [Ampulex compressa]
MAFKVEIQSDLEYFLKIVAAGGIAGMCSKTTVAPLDRIKILLQAHNEHYRHLGVFSGLKEIIRREAFFALYKGNFAQMIRIFPYAATQYTAFEFYKKYLGGLFKKHSDIDKLLAGSAAGVTAVAITYPLDTIRSRLAFQVTGEHLYSGITHTAVSIFKESVGIIDITESFRKVVLERYIEYLSMVYAPNYLCNKCNRNTGGLVLSLPAKLLCGGIAGAVAQMISYPLDVTRRRMQLAMMNPATHKYGSGMQSTIALIYKENGIIKGLYRGMSINYLRAIPMVSVSFTVYEIMKQVLNLDTGMEL